jgi:serine/threonine-protein kinase
MWPSPIEIIDFLVSKAYSICSENKIIAMLLACPRTPEGTMTVEDFLNGLQLVKAFKDTGQKKVSLMVPQGDGTPVIIKIGKSSSAGSFQRAKREVEVQRTLSSGYYPKNLDFKLFPDGRFVIVEEYIKSEALSSCFSKFTEPKDILVLLKHLVSGLELIWTSKITHRDLKPDNILIKPDKTPVIIDLGILLAEDRTALTASYAPCGPCTPGYAAPEQLKNRRAEIDHRTDQFVLGIDCLQLIEGGRHPFDPGYVGVGLDIPDNILNGNLKKDILETEKYIKMKPLIVKLLAPEPYKRYINPDALKFEIEKCIGAYNEA